MKSFLFLSFLFMLVACSDSGDIKDVVRQNLKDPESAQFREITFSADKKRACVVWNAKNSMGGYGDWSISELKKENSEWVITAIRGDEEHCSKVGFFALDEGEKAQAIARQNAIKIIKEVRKLSMNDAIEIGIVGECGEVVHAYAYISGQIVKYRILQNNNLIKINEELLVEARDKIYNGLC